MNFQLKSYIEAVDWISPFEIRGREVRDFLELDLGTAGLNVPLSSSQLQMSHQAWR
ncbi:MAG: hypothetical protein H0U87_06890 [Acidobacteria bacterium]|nr:hypothetical protein [Acidobacteriota bacterium]